MKRIHLLRSLRRRFQEAGSRLNPCRGGGSLSAVGSCLRLATCFPVLVVLSVGLLSAFRGARGSISNQIQRKEIELQKVHSLLGQKEALLEAYKKLAPSLDSALKPDERMNQWVRRITSDIEKAGLKLDKLEPQGLRTVEGIHRFEILIRLSGQMTDLLTFLDSVASQNPLLLLKKLKISKAESSSGFLEYELLVTSLS